MEVMKLDLVEMGLVPVRCVKEVESEGVGAMRDFHVVFVEAREGRREGGACAETGEINGCGKAARSGRGKGRDFL